MNLTETITWHDTRETLPDDDTSVLIIIGGDPEVWVGYLDGGEWRHWDSMPCDTPLYWTHLPAGPNQQPTNHQEHP